jgi:tRNA(Arg) A34 adenosine deaminase TadA
VTDFAQRTSDLARQNVVEGGRPFATVIVKDGEIVVEVYRLWNERSCARNR